MAIYTIGDLHLSFNENKPMSVFGENWEGYEEKVKENWTSMVTESDMVILPGDFSWSMYLKDTYKDFEYLNSLPGKKLLLKGNHDYWWSTVNSMRNYIKENQFKDIDFIYNNAYEFENRIIVGTRGWSFGEDPESKKMIQREVARLELSIKNGIENYGEDKEIIAFLHYPPIVNQNIQNNEMNEFIKMLKKYDIKKCYYGHLHSTAIKDAVEGEHFGIDFKLVSADAIQFNLIKVE